MKEEKVKVKLAPRYRKTVIKELNKKLDEYRIYGQEWNKEIIRDLILDNLTKNTTIKLIDELNALSISEWND